MTKGLRRPLPPWLWAVTTYTFADEPVGGSRDTDAPGPFSLYSFCMARRSL